MFSIIIPCRDRESAIIRTLDSVESLYATNLIKEVIVVADGYELSNELRRRFPKAMFLSYPIRRGSYYARNFASSKAKGSWLFFIDTDMFFSKKNIEPSFPFLDEFDYLAFKCKIELNNSQNFLEKYFSKGAFRFEKHFKNELYGGTGFLMVKKQVFEDVGGFDERLYSGGDNLFGKQVHKRGYQMTFCDKETVWHGPKSLKQHVQGILRKEQHLYLLKFLYPHLYQKQKWPMQELWHIIKSALYFIKKPKSLKNDTQLSRAQFLLAHYLELLIRAVAAIMGFFLVFRFKYIKST